MFNTFVVFGNSDPAKKMKILKTTRVEIPPSIDGKLGESVWQQSEKASNFVMFTPEDGTPEREAQLSVVYVLYDDEALYVGARLYDDNPDEIPKELGDRDDYFDRNTDFFAVNINPYNDGQQNFNFIVTAAGVQGDDKWILGAPGPDITWNAVWDSSVAIDEEGWTVEIKIPYSELRFPDGEKQVWGLNFFRMKKKHGEFYSWSYVDRAVGEWLQHNGELHGIQDIEPPTRLSFMPYISGYVDDSEGESNFSYSLGMDLKYGINESFTLDMTLIPDFGQTTFDELVLNLGPFEVRYDENRQFFTEGTELFGKGNLFYSRRIGGIPSKYYNVENDTDPDAKEVLSNPSKTPLLNATKVSGRTKGGLGIGVFNAVTNKTVAKIKDLESGETKKVVTEPIANYNVFVLDKRFNSNSSVSLVNTNVTRSGEFRDANVTGLLFDLANKANSYKIFGEGKYSHIVPEPDSIKGGFQSSLGFAKTKGKFRFNHVTRLTDENYDITDLGFMTYRNIWEIDTEFSYEIFEPVKNFNNYRFSLGVHHDRQFAPDHFIKLEMLLRVNAQTRGFFSFGGGIWTSVLDKYDFYEPRVKGRYLLIPPAYNIYGWIETDGRKKFAIGSFMGGGQNRFWDKSWFFFGVSPRFRFNDKLSLEMEIFRETAKNDVGWVNELDNSDIIMGIRDKRNLTVSLGGTFTFNNKMSMSLKFRHYWDNLKYNDFKKLTDNGGLSDIDYDENHDTTFNSWNVDLSYSWWFAPGSQVSVLYRNSLLSSLDMSGFSYFENFENMFHDHPQNVLSVKLVYYLDYNSIKNIF